MSVCFFHCVLMSIYWQQYACWSGIRGAVVQSHGTVIDELLPAVMLVGRTLSPAELPSGVAVYLAHWWRCRHAALLLNCRHALIGRRLSLIGWVLCGSALSGGGDMACAPLASGPMGVGCARRWLVGSVMPLCPSLSLRAHAPCVLAPAPSHSSAPLQRGVRRLDCRCQPAMTTVRAQSLRR